MYLTTCIWPIRRPHHGTNVDPIKGKKCLGFLRSAFCKRAGTERTLGPCDDRPSRGRTVGRSATHVSRGLNVVMYVRNIGNKKREPRGQQRTGRNDTSTCRVILARSFCVSSVSDIVQHCQTGSILGGAYHLCSWQETHLVGALGEVRALELETWEPGSWGRT